MTEITVPTTVIHCKKQIELTKKENYVYIGRKRGKEGFWGNPFSNRCLWKQARSDCSVSSTLVGQSRNS